MSYRIFISKEVASFPDIFHDLLHKLSSIIIDIMARCLDVNVELECIKRIKLLKSH